MQQDTAQISTESTEPYPPRYWWLKRLTACGIGLILLLVGLRIWWGYEAHKRLTAEIAAIQARGEPIFPEDFQPPTIPDAENAAYYLKLAVAAMDPLADPPMGSVLEYGSYFPYPPEWHTVADKAVIANRVALDYTRQARNYDKVDWGLQYSSPVMNIFANNTLLPQLGQQRELAIRLADAAIHAHLNGDDAAALEYIRDVLFTAQAVDQETLLIPHLVSNGFRAMATHKLQLISPGLMIGDVPSTSPSSRPASRVQAQAIIDELLDEPFYRNALRRSLLGQRMVQLDETQQMIKNTKLLRPKFELDAVRMIRVNAALLRATEQSNWPTAKAMPNGNVSFVKVYFWHLADRRMTAVSLAARLYQIDHNGNWPPTLQALVPDYLPAVPIDPLAGDGRPLRYILARGGTRPVVYSVGENEGDDTLDEFFLPSQPLYGWQIKAMDQWRDLSRWVPSTTTAPTNGAVSDQIGLQ